MRNFSFPVFFLLTLSVICHANSVGLSNDPQNPTNPQTITLTTGQVVPFGIPGVICDNVCGRDAGHQIITSSRRWLLAIPVTAGIFAAVMISREHGSIPLSVTHNSGTTLTKPADNQTITATSGSIATAVPEPKTIFSFGIGALLILVTIQLRRLKS